MFFRNQWGAVCARVWKESDAQVVCRQLGLYGLSISYGVKRDTDVPLLLSYVDCSGNESTLAECAVRGWRSSPVCFHGAKVYCQTGEIIVIKQKPMSKFPPR